MVEEGSLYRASIAWSGAAGLRRSGVHRSSAAGRSCTASPRGAASNWPPRWIPGSAFRPSVSKILLPRMKQSLRSWLWRVPLDQEVDEGIAFHLEMRTRELVASGDGPSAGAAGGRPGAWGAIARGSNERVWTWPESRNRDMRLIQWFDAFRDDVKFAVRQMRSTPGLHVALPPSRSRSASVATARSSRWWTRRCSARCRFLSPVVS